VVTTGDVSEAVEGFWTEASRGCPVGLHLESCYPQHNACGHVDTQ
jgi:hypothetical protein